MSFSRYLLLLCFLTATGASQAVQQVRVLALFPEKAMLEIDGKRRILKAGQTSPEGVQLVAANAREATVSWGGQERVLHPGGSVSANYAAVTRQEVRIVRDNRGSYTTSGTINGRATDFLVDTGANGVAMSVAHARALGIPYQLTGTPIQVGTAGGVVSGYRVVLDKVRIGAVELNQVSGVVIEADTSLRVLLGMSFLQRLDISQTDNIMVLRERH